MKPTFLNSIATSFVFLFVSASFAQENVFLDRDYWKNDPSIAQIEKDIALGNDITELNESMFDAVSYALIEKTDNAIVKHLLSKKGNEVDKLTHDGRTYIFWAAYKDNLEIMEYLVARGAKANIEDSHGYSVLNFAAVTGQTNPKLYDFLLANKADIKATNHSGANALLLVMPFVEDYGFVQYFLDKGLALESMDNDGNGIFQYAAKGGHIPVLKTLIQKGVAYKKTNNKEGNAVLMASQGTRGTQNTLETFQFLEEQGLEMNISNREGKNPLHAIASRNEDVKVYQYFMDKGVNINQQDANGSTPFMNAAYGNSLEIVEFLSTAVEDINTKDKKGRSALVLAVSRNRPDVVAFLLDNKADINAVDEKGNTLAYYLLNNFNAKKPERFEAKLKLLQGAGLEISKPQYDGNTVVHIAAKENNLPLLKRLADFGIDINQKNGEGNTALHLAAMTSDNDAILKYLIAQGADKTAKTGFDESVYDLAMENELLQTQKIGLDFLK